jgi:hypothetical protein
VATRLAHDVRATRAVAHGRRSSWPSGTTASRRASGRAAPAARGRAAARPAVLLHGFSSRKEQMADGVGAVLLAHGIASLAIDLPLHGERIAEGQATSWGSSAATSAPSTARRCRTRSPSPARGAPRSATRGSPSPTSAPGARWTARASPWSATRWELPRRAGGGRRAAVRALVLAAGGDLPDGDAVRAGAAPRRRPAPRRAALRRAPAAHGARAARSHRAPEQAQRLFDAAMEPKELRWYDAGHYLPQPPLDDAARLAGGAAALLGARTHDRGAAPSGGICGAPGPRAVPGPSPAPSVGSTRLRVEIEWARGLDGGPTRRGAVVALRDCQPTHAPRLRDAVRPVPRRDAAEPSRARERWACIERDR